MLAGMVVSSVSGGLAGFVYGVTQDHGALQLVLAYQLGGMAAFLTFLLLASPHGVTARAR